MTWEGFSNLAARRGRAHMVEKISYLEKKRACVLTGVEMIEAGNTSPRHLGH